MLCAMLDGEATSKEIDRMLERLKRSSALRATWERLCQGQAIVHKHEQQALHIDLSTQIAARISRDEQASIPTPIVRFPSDSVRAAGSTNQGSNRQSQEPDSAKRSCSIAALASIRQARRPECAQAQSELSLKMSTAQQRRLAKRSPQWLARWRNRGLKRRLVAHLAVAASVASFTVWTQNQFVYSRSANQTVAQSQSSSQVANRAVNSNQQRPVSSTANLAYSEQMNGLAQQRQVSFAEGEASNRARQNFALATDAVNLMNQAPTAQESTLPLSVVSSRAVASPQILENASSQSGQQLRLIWAAPVQDGSIATNEQARMVKQ